MMDSYEWFKPHKDFTIAGLWYPLEFEESLKYETYHFSKDPLNTTSIKNGMNYITLINSELDELGKIIIGPNPFQQEKIYWDKFQELEDAGLDEKSIVSMMGEITYG